jgi:hypothetical protein
MPTVGYCTIMKLRRKPRKPWKPIKKSAIISCFSLPKYFTKSKNYFQNMETKLVEKS